MYRTSVETSERGLKMLHAPQSLQRTHRYCVFGWARIRAEGVIVFLLSSSTTFQVALLTLIMIMLCNANVPTMAQTTKLGSRTTITCHRKRRILSLASML